MLFDEDWGREVDLTSSVKERKDNFLSLCNEPTPAEAGRIFKGVTELRLDRSDGEWRNLRFVGVGLQRVARLIWKAKQTDMEWIQKTNFDQQFLQKLVEKR